ncbi:probable calcium-binding protein CML43 [Juglans microcarpa x Juglans regia]|uniref:probable calcium-binding protein CML43 n=1 Tax=Juglans microcarpa x Juglans regia TaxID=2249226 RepID=UPI001B7DC6D8|nr:probable calcium-binding protein CML43 [Juglans microcarpa x Juglans regia]
MYVNKQVQIKVFTKEVIGNRQSMVQKAFHPLVEKAFLPSMSNITGITDACSRLIGDRVLHAFGSSRASSAATHLGEDHHGCKQQNARKVDDTMVRALITVFGMKNNGRIKKENARRVVEMLGLIYSTPPSEEDKSGFELPGEGVLDDDNEVPIEEEVLGGFEDASKQAAKHLELLREAFKIFDEDGDGYIEAVELKRVLECLGLDEGLDMDQIEKMVRIVDSNLDGKVDFSGFELMMK